MPKLSNAAARDECRTLLRLAWPVGVAQFAQTANGFVDTLMAGQASAHDLAGVAIGTSLWLPVFLALVGLLSGLTAIVSHLHGAGRDAETGVRLRHALMLAFPVGIAALWLLREALPVLQWLGTDPALIPIAMGYLKATAWGFPGIALFLAFRFYCEGLGHTRPGMHVSLIGLALNIPADYVLVFGVGGFPALGGEGCGWATALVMWVMAVAMGIQAMRLDRRHATRFRERPAPGSARRHVQELVRIGTPVGVMMSLEAGIFCCIGLLISRMGAEVVAAHQVALNVSSLVFMWPLSLSIALSIRVGHCMGAGDAIALRRSVRVGMALTIGLAVINALVMGLAREPIAALYSRDPAVLALAGQLLMFAALFQVSDGVQVGANGALRGMKDTRVPLLMILFSFWCVALGVGGTLGFGLGGADARGVHGFWMGLIAGLTTAACLLSLRLVVQLRRIMSQIPSTLERPA